MEPEEQPHTQRHQSAYEFEQQREDAEPSAQPGSDPNNNSQFFRATTRKPVIPSVVRRAVSSAHHHSQPHLQNQMSDPTTVASQKPLFSPQHQQNLSSSSLDDAIHTLLQRVVPYAYDCIAKYQYQQALSIMREESLTTWKCWDAFVLMLRLLAACETSYNLMKYLDDEAIQSDAIDAMYQKLLVLCTHLGSEVKSSTTKRSRFLQFGTSSRDRSEVSNSSAHSPTASELEYYAELFDESAMFFALRLPLIAIYRSLALMPTSHEYEQYIQALDGLLERAKLVSHPLLETLKLSLVQEIETLLAGFRAEETIATYQYTQSIVALHKLKSTLRHWSEHIDSLMDYCFGDESGDDSDGEEEDTPSNMSRSSSESSSYRGSSVVFRRKSVSCVMDLSTDKVASSVGDDTVKRRPSVSTTTEEEGAFRKQKRLVSMRPLLLKRGLSVSSITSRSQRSTKSGLVESSMECSAARKSLSVNTTLWPVVEEKEEGFALPVYQWASKLYRSLVAKFSLYFHQWLTVYESRGDLLPSDLLRFVRNPFGVSYLQLMEKVLSRSAASRNDDGNASVLFLLETEQLPQKGACFYIHGYRCPPRPLASTEQTSPGFSPQVPSTTPALRALASPSQSQISSPLFKHAVTGEEACKEREFTSLWGLGAWPAVLCFPPQDPPRQHWPNIVSLILDNCDTLGSNRARSNGIITHMEKRMKTTYHITKIDRCVYMVVLFEGKRRTNDKALQDFMISMSESLQHIPVFQSAKRWRSK